MQIASGFPWSMSDKDGHIRNSHGAVILRTPRRVGLETTRLAAAAPGMFTALRRVVDWHAKRNSTFDELLPIDQQEPEIQQAMRALIEAEG